MRLGQILDGLRAFEAEAHDVLSSYESSPSRIISLNQTYDRLENLSLKQEELFRQAIRCAEEELYRAAHVMAWAGAVDILLEKLSESFSALQEAEPNWKGDDIHEMAEYVAEFLLVGALKTLGLATKNQVKTLHGLLHRRNQCAHPTDYWPNLNETLGYISEVMTAVARFQEK